MTLSEFTTPDGKPDDRAWLGHTIYTFVLQQTANRRRDLPNSGISERQIYDAFSSHGSSPRFERPSWWFKTRRVRREMIKATLCRLVNDGKIAIASEDENVPNYREKMYKRTWAQVFGSDHDRKLRTYITVNALDAIADALKRSDAGSTT